MNVAQLLKEELVREMESTRKILECVPEGNNDWRPHEKSFALGRLASHVAEIPHWIGWILESNELDMVARPFERKVCESHEELMQYFENKHKDAIELLDKATIDDLSQSWTFRAGERVIFTSSRYHAIRSWGFNHLVHHRGQLGVYLRLLDIPIPGMYGPSTDDRERMAAATN